MLCVIVTVEWRLGLGRSRCASGSKGIGSEGVVSPLVYGDISVPVFIARLRASVSSASLLQVSESKRECSFISLVQLGREKKRKTSYKLMHSLSNHSRSRSPPPHERRGLRKGRHLTASYSLSQIKPMLAKSKTNFIELIIYVSSPVLSSR